MVMHRNLGPFDTTAIGLGEMPLTIENNLAWYLMNGRLSAQRARTVTSYINRLLPRVRAHAVDLVDAFGYSDKHIGATIGTGVEAERQAEAREYYRRQRASGDAPVSEKSLKKKAKASA